MGKSSLYLLLFVLLSFFASAAAEGDIPFRKSLILNVEISSKIGIESYSSSSYLEYVKVDLNYLPSDSFRQKIITLNTKPKAELKDHVIFTWQNPGSDRLDFLLQSSIETKGDFPQINKKVPFPIKSYPVDVYRYTKPTAMIDTNEGIKELAASLAEGEDDLYNVLFRLAVWTNQNIEYDLSSVAANAVEPSSWVLKNRRGVCDELTNLFISMARSLGIPARFVTGISYTNSPEFKNHWGLHGWAEVYFQGFGWVPFDPTYGQPGFVDAGHIKLKDSPDSNRSSTDYEWKGRYVNLKPEELRMDVSVVKRGKMLPQLVDVSVQAFDDKLGFGSYNYGEAQAKNNNDYYVTSTLYLSLPKEIALLDPVKQPVILGPHEKKSVFWRMKVPDNLRRNMVYTFPLTVTTQRNYSVDTGFDARYEDDMLSLQTINRLIEQKNEEMLLEVSNDVLFFCSAKNDEVDAGGLLEISCTLQNNKRTGLSSINVCFLDDCKETPLIRPGGSKEISFYKRFDDTGGNFLVITAKNNEISKSAYLNILVLDRPLVNISDLRFPSHVGFDDEFSINFTLSRESYAVPQNTKIILYQNKNMQSFEVGSLKGDIPFTINMNGKSLFFGKNTFQTVVEYSDKNGDTYSSKEEFTITLEKTTFLQKVQVILNQAYLFVERMVDKIS